MRVDLEAAKRGEQQQPGAERSVFKLYPPVTGDEVARRYWRRGLVAVGVGVLVGVVVVAVWVGVGVRTGRVKVGS